jgi:hypothetical protein
MKVTYPMSYDSTKSIDENLLVLSKQHNYEHLNEGNLKEYTILLRANSPNSTNWVDLRSMEKLVPLLLCAMKPGLFEIEVYKYKPED